MKNLILTAAIETDPVQSELFIKSLRKYYNDEVYFLVGKNDDDLKKILTLNQCKYIEVNVHRFDIQIKRYNYFLKILKEGKYRQVLLCDSRDIYFQSNPFDFNFKGSINFFLEDEKIKNCPFNSNWLIKTHGKQVFEKIKNNIILCSGTVLATNKSMIEYLELMKSLIEKKKYKKSLKYLLTFRRDKNGRGCDQAHANFVGHNQLIKDAHFYSNESGPIATVYYLKKIVFDKNYNLLNKLGVPYKIVHQYDKRWNEFYNVVEKLKKRIN